MNSKKGNKRYNSKYPNIILATLLLYPILFSFSHSLTHHLEAHQHLRQEEQQTNRSSSELSDCSFLNDIGHSKKCPICEYKFAPGLKTAKQTLQSEIRQIATFNFPLSESIPAQELFSKSSPRAPPICS